MKKQKDKKNSTTTGTLRVHPRGFGFLVPDEREIYPEDIFIPKHLTRGAVDGDRVEIEVNLESPSEKGLDGRVLKILTRGRSHVGGTILRVQKGGAAYAYIPLLGPSKQMKIAPSSERKFTAGDRIVIKVIEWGSEHKEPLGEMSSYIGHILDPSCDIPAAIQEYDLPKAFAEKVLEEAKAYGTSVSKKEIEEREDLRSLETFTIDPETAKDFDDALSLSQDKKGHFHLAVHVADVSHYVRPGTLLDNEARLRSNSTYFPGHVIPMLPHELSSHLCSLKPHVNRLAVTVFMTLDETGTLLNYRIARSTIKSAHRFSYKEAKEVLDGKRKSKYRETLFMMCELCHLLKKKRYERGSIEFSIPSLEIGVNEKGEPCKVELVEYDITHQLVEEFMLKANEIVATHLSKEGKPLTYRIHDEPNPENMKDFSGLVRAFGFKLSAKPTSEELQALFDQIKESPFSQFLATAFIRSMKLAAYSVQNIGHYGLGLEYYTHFTSPIRRYIDLIVHRVLFDGSAPDEDLDKISLQCSDSERLSAKAENSVSSLKKLRLLDCYNKEEPERIYDAVITQIKPFGVIFEVTDLLMEGFLPISMLEGDYFVFNEGSKTLVGKQSGFSFRSGQKMKVNLVTLDLVTQETKWKMHSEKKEERKNRKKRRRRR